MNLYIKVIAVLCVIVTAAILMEVGYLFGSHSVPLYHFDNGGTVTIGCTK